MEFGSITNLESYQLRTISTVSMKINGPACIQNFFLNPQGATLKNNFLHDFLLTDHERHLLM